MAYGHGRGGRVGGGARKCCRLGLEYIYIYIYMYVYIYIYLCICLCMYVFICLYCISI